MDREDVAVGVLTAVFGSVARTAPEGNLGKYPFGSSFRAIGGIVVCTADGKNSIPIGTPAAININMPQI